MTIHPSRQKIRLIHPAHPEYLRGLVGSPPQLLSGEPALLHSWLRHTGEDVVHHNAADKPEQMAVQLQILLAEHWLHIPYQDDPYLPGEFHSTVHHRKLFSTQDQLPGGL